MYYPIGWPRKLRFKYKDPSSTGRTTTVDPDQASSVDSAPNITGTGGNADAVSTASVGSFSDKMIHVSSNSDKTIFLVLTKRALHLWFAKPSVEIASHCRNHESLENLGYNDQAHWKPDSAIIVVKTTLNVLIFYRVAFKNDVELVYEQRDTSQSNASFSSHYEIPSLYLLMSFSTRVTPGITSFLAAEEEVVVATKSGELIGVNWDGSLDESFRWEITDGRDDSFYIVDMKYSSMIGGFSFVFLNGKIAYMPIHDQHPHHQLHQPPASPAAPILPPEPQEPVACNGSPGSNLSTSPGVTSSATRNNSVSSSSSSHNVPPPSSSTSNLHSSHPPRNPHTGCSTSAHPRRVMNRRTSMPNVSSRVQFVPDVSNGVTSAINHKYQLIAYGLSNSKGILCITDDENCTLIITHHLILPSNSIPDCIMDSIGSMNTLSWSPDSMVLASSWQYGGLALWSVFGSLLMCTLSWEYGSPHVDSPLSESNNSSSSVACTSRYLSASSFAWGKEGYQLWIVSPNETLNYKSNFSVLTRKMSSVSTASTSNNECNNSSSISPSCEYLLQMSFAKSILATNPTITTVSREILLLTSEDKLYIGVACKSNGFNGHNMCQQQCSTNGTQGDDNMSHKISTLSLSSSSSSAATSLSDQCVDDSLNNVSEKLSSSEIGSHQWLIIPINDSYLRANCPIRFTAVDSSGTLIAIAGRSGLTYYSLLTKRWKLFVNENQEKSFEVYSSMWFHSNVSLIASCYNFDESCFEIRSYPLNERLDNQFMKRIKFNIEILHISIFAAKLLVMTADGVFTLISLNDAINGLSSRSSTVKDATFGQPNGQLSHSNEGNSALSLSSFLSASTSHGNNVSSLASTSATSSSSSSSSFSLSSCHNHSDLTVLNTIVISNILVPPESVISIFLTNLHSRSRSLNDDATDATAPEAILLNISGRVILLERDLNSDSTSTLETLKLPSMTGSSGTITCPIDSSYLDHAISTLIYRAVSTLASGVEHVWIPPLSRNTSNGLHESLDNSLWLSRGSNGLNIWLPLQPSRAFMSNRIMLPISTRVYPLGILISDALIIGAENDTHVYSSIPLPVTLSSYCTIVRTSEVYLHHILRELLKRNEGKEAWDIANQCSNLTYFSHSLELLLHETLEEEATSSAPIPVPLLPQVVAFISEFKSIFLSTVVQCARKTELTLWSHLFSIVGNPKDLFTQCLQQGKLQIASSYLLILQNMEKTSVSRKYAVLLLEACLKDGKKNLAKEIKRYLDSTDPSDLIG